MTARLAWIFFLVIYFVAYPLVASGSPQEDEVGRSIWESEPFAASKDDLIAWSQHVQENPPNNGVADSQNSNGEDAPDMEIQRLLCQTRFAFQTDGSMVVTRWYIEKALSKDAATEIGRLEADWQPWKSDRPSIRVRTIDPAGNERIVNDDNAIEQSAGSGRGLVLTDDKRLVLVVEGVSEGSLIESTVETTIRPTFDSTWSCREPLTDVNPYHIQRLVLDAQGSTQLQHRCYGPKIEAVESKTSSGNARVVYHVQDPKRLFEVIQPFCGPEDSSYSIVQFGVYAPWKRIGQQYAEKIESCISGGSTSVKLFVNEVRDRAASWTEQEKIAWCESQIRDLVRYTSLALGESSIVPASPDVVLSRKFGDCKDVSTLMVTMLRELGVPANVALLRSGRGLDVGRDEGGLNLFNHAIVYVPSRELWLDLANEPVGPAQLPESAQGRQALIADKVDSRLIPTPHSKSDSNTDVQIRTIPLGFAGKGQLSILYRNKGLTGLQMRSTYEKADAKTMLESWGDAFKEIVGTSEVVSLQKASLSDDEYAIRVKASMAQLADRDRMTMTVQRDVKDFLRQLPEAVLSLIERDAEGNVVQKPRTYPLYITSGKKVVHEFNLLVPVAIQCDPLPENQAWQIGNANLQVAFSVGDTPPQPIEITKADWQDISVAPRDRPESWAPEFERQVQIHLSYQIEPGYLSVDEANQLGELLVELMQPDNPLSQPVSMTWKSYDEVDRDPSSETLYRFAEEVSRCQAYSDARLALLHLLATYRVIDYPTVNQVSENDFDPTEGLSRELLAKLMILNNEDFYPSIPYDRLPELRAQFQGREQLFSSEFSSIVLLANMLGPNGTRSLDVSRIKEVERVASLFMARADVAGNTRFMNMLQEELFLTSLMLRKDSEAEKQAQKLGGVSNQMIASTFRKNKFRPTGRLRPSDIALDAQDTWQLLISVGRWDLANRLRNTSWPDLAKSHPELNEESQRLAPLDPTNAESVARHTIHGMMNGDRESLGSLLVPSLKAAKVTPRGTASPLLPRTWIGLPPNSWTQPLIAVVANNLKAESVNLTDKIIAMTFRWQEVPTLYSLYLFQSDDGNWRVIPEGSLAECGSFLLERVQKGEAEEVAKYLQHGYGPNPKRAIEFLPWANMGLFYDSLQLQTSSEHTELFVRVIAALEQQDSKLIEEWVSQHGESLAAYQKSMVVDAVIESLRESDQVDKFYRYTLERAEKKPSAENLYTLVHAVEHSRFSDPTHPSDDRWRELVSTHLERNRKNVISQSIRLSWNILNDQADKGFEILEADLESSTKVEPNLVNTYLWSSLIQDCSVEVLRERLQKVESLPAMRDTKNPALQHTLGCAYAVAEDPMRAMEMLKQCAGFYKHDSATYLLRGMILFRLHLPEDAKYCFEQAIQHEPYTGSGYLAKLWLKKIAP